MYLLHTIAQTARRITRLQRELSAAKRKLATALKQREVYKQEVSFWGRRLTTAEIKKRLRKPRKVPLKSKSRLHPRRGLFSKMAF